MALRYEVKHVKVPAYPDGRDRDRWVATQGVDEWGQREGFRRVGELTEIARGVLAPEMYPDMQIAEFVCVVSTWR